MKKRPGKQKETAAGETRAWCQVDRLQLAKLLGVHPDTVSDYARQGMPTLDRGGAGRTSTYDAVACLDWWRSTQGKNVKEVAQARALKASAELNEIKIAREQGRLLSRDDVVLAGQSYTKAWVAHVRAIPRRLIQGGLIVREQEPAVAAICRAILTEIATWRTVADANRSTKGAAA